MKKVYLALLVVGLWGEVKAQRDGQIKLHVQTSQVAPQLSSYLSVEKGLNPFLNQLNATYTLEHDVPVMFCDCGVSNAFYTPSVRQVTICYEWLDQQLKLLTQKTGNKDYYQKVQGVMLVPLLQELGMALLHQLNYPLDGKEAEALDEFALVSLAANPNHEYFWPLHYGLLAKYYYARSLSASEMAPNEENMAIAYAPDLDRYYQLRALLSGAYPDLALQAGTIGDNRSAKNKYKLDEARFETSTDEYQRVARQWESRLGTLSLQKLTLPPPVVLASDTPSVPEPVATGPASTTSLVTTTAVTDEKMGAITIPLYRVTNIELENWRIKSHPLSEVPFRSAHRESVRRVYEVRINQQGELISANANPSLARGKCPEATEVLIEEFIRALKFEQTTSVAPTNHTGRVVVAF